MIPIVNITQVFQKAFEAMPQKFTGDMFVAKLRKLGLSADEIKYYEKRRVAFYKKNCTSYGKRSYEKRNLFTSNVSQVSFETAVAIVKKAGCKVLKPNTTFEEI